MPQAGIILKLPKGSAPPHGYTFVRSLRTKNVYKKNAPAYMPQADVDALIEGLAKMGFEAEVVDDLGAALGALALGGSRTRRRRRHRRRTTRRH